MWHIKKFCCFQFLTFIIFTWMIVDLTKASQDDNADTVAVAGAGPAVDIVDAVAVDGDGDGDVQLSGQLFEFAQFFSTVNFNSTQTNKFNERERKKKLHK